MSRAEQLVLLAPSSPSPDSGLLTPQSSLPMASSPSLSAQPAEGGAGAWVHSASGLSLPRGSLVVREASEQELLDLEVASIVRGARRGAQVARHVKRSVAESNALDEFCGWLSGNAIDGFGTVTFTDQVAEKRRIYSLRRAIEVVRLELRHAGMKNGRQRGYTGRYVLAGEWHPSGRLVPHVHIAFETFRAEGVCRDLFRHFSNTFGRCRFEPMRDIDTATLYALKDTIKATSKDPDSLYLRLTRPRISRGKR
jgi:hypothetical protein